MDIFFAYPSECRPLQQGRRLEIMRVFLAGFYVFSGDRWDGLRG